MCQVLEYGDTDLLLGVGLKLEALLIAGTDCRLSVAAVLSDLETRFYNNSDVLIRVIRRNTSLGTNDKFMV